MTTQVTKSQLREIARKLAVTEHSEYRSFLSAIYREAKNLDNSYSYARFSLDLALGSTNAHSIIAGRRPLTLKAAEKICDILNLVGASRKYLLALVQQERAKTISEKEEAFSKKLEIRQKILPNELDRRQLNFFEDWHHAAILELLRLERAESTEEWISANIRPEISKPKVKSSLELLTSLGYLRFDPIRQRLYPAEISVSTGNDVAGLAIMSFHRQMLKLSLESLDNIEADRRDVSAITVTASEELIAQMRDEIIALRKRFLMLASQEEAKASEVVQVNIQLFPLTRKRRD